MRWPILLVFLVSSSTAVPAMYGEILSPNYPQGYPDNTRESWNITVPLGFGIRIYFTHLNIEPSENCEYDSVKVVIGDITEMVLCGRGTSKAAGSPILEERYFHASMLTVTFQSDFSNQERYTGFAAYYMAVDVNECEELEEEACSHFCNNYIGGYFCSCRPEYFLDEDNRTCAVNCSGAVYTDLKGEITSPNYPSPYPENSRCEYHIQLEAGYQVVVTFLPQDFDIEQHEDGSCAYDSLAVMADGRMFGPFCGKQVPSPQRMETKSNKATLVFQTDSGGQNKGWKIQYSEDAIPCPKEVTANAMQSPQQEKYVFKDVVRVTCLKGYEIVMVGSSQYSFISDCQGNGQWRNSHLKCQPLNCGHPEDIENGNIAYISGSESYSYGTEIQYSCTERFYKMKSRGDGRYRCSEDGTWKNRIVGEEVPTCKPVCGIPGEPLPSLGRIFGGTRAKDGNFPWQVFIETPRGGGALVSEQWVMTAAHVVDDTDSPSMFAGLTNVADRTSLHRLQAAKIKVHPGWKTGGILESRSDFDNDIALIKLEKKVTMNKLLSPICLPGRDPKYTLDSTSFGYISGWGRTEKAKQAKYLHKAMIPVVSMEKCKSVKVADTDTSNYVFSDNMICAGGGKNDSCQGDSGGAFVLEDPYVPNGYYAGGIVSWGPLCGTYGIYTKVSNYLDWIEETMSKEEDEETSP
ncbi:complement C1s subcomponent [Rhinatrema bivittatum]|uniref:complement C1s subcomponent n=1 Tax=Rhinatrema bivittatum TaxID=194408 RepID=UPI00112C62B6|nr:complement C1s subcomponent [Rhinatrema bivittatum]